MSREVELIIRAKDEASKFVDSITDSLKQLTNVQKDVGKSAQTTGSLLEQLGQEFRDLNDEAKRLSSLGKIAQGLERSNAAVKDLGNTLGSAASDFAALSRESENASRSADKLRNSLETEQAALKASKDARRQASEELRKANEALKEAERNQRNLNRATKVTPAGGSTVQLPFSNAEAINSARALQARLKDDIAGYTTEIKRSSEAIDSLKPQVQAAARQQAALAEQTEKASGSLGKNLDTLERARGEFTGLKTAADQASTAMGGIAVTQDDVAKASARVAAELARTKAQIEGISKAPRVTAPGADISSDTKDTDSRRAAVERLRDLRKELALAQADAQRLNSALKSSASPTVELGTAAGQAQTHVRDLKSELADLRTRLRASEGGFRAWSEAASTLRSSTSGASAAASSLASASGQAWKAIAPLGSAAQGAGQGLNNAARGGNGLRDALNGLYGDSRKALSLMQRLRGEVLSLTAGYFGLQAAISNIGGVITSFQTLEAAQNRLGAVFNQDTGKVTQELDFLDRQAARLGIQFGLLSDQYAKFAVAANAANFSSEATRKIFVSVAEAGRVNKLSTEQLEGVFLALEQMISKGKVSSEELRRQLGDRLPGAFNIFASAIGVSTAELDKMMRKGQVLSDQSNLLKFASELDKRFGSQLTTALQSTTSELGRFSNNIFEAQLLVARGGFIDSFTDGLRKLNEYFQSRDGRDFFLAIGAALGRFIETLSQLPKYFDQIKLGLEVFASVKVAGALSSMIGAFKAASVEALTFQRQITAIGPPTQQFIQQQGTLGRSLNSTIGRIDGWRAAFANASGGLRAVGTGLTAIRPIVIGATALFRTLWAAVGGLPGIAITAITIGIGAWATSINDATSALDEHQRQMQAVKTAYDEAKNKAQDWSLAVRGVTISQAEDNLSKLLDAYGSRFDELDSKAGDLRTTLKTISESGSGFGSGVDKSAIADAQKLVDLLDKMKSRTISLDQFRAGLDEIARSTQQSGIRAAAVDMQNFLDVADDKGQTLEKLNTAIEESQKKLRLMKGEATEAEKALLAGKDATEEASKAINVIGERADKFADALEEMNKLIPGVGAELKKLKEIDALDKQFEAAKKLVGSVQELLELTDRYNKIKTQISFGDIGDTPDKASFNLIRRFEGKLQQTPFTDSDGQLRIGFSSDTITRADGSVQHGINPGDMVSLTDAIRDLDRRISEQTASLKDQIGEDRYNSFSAQQQGVLNSLAYNYGNISKTGIVDTIKTGTVQEIADAIRGLAGHNGGINAGRRRQEADIFETGGDDEAMSEKTLDNERKRVEKQKEYNTDLQTRLGLQEAENSNAGKLTKEAFIQKQLAEEQRKAKAADVTLDDDQIKRIQAAAAAEFDLKQQKVEGTAATKEANIALQQAIALSQQRSALQAQLNQAQKLGDSGAALTAQQNLDGVNAQLAEAIEKARAMWEAIGGEQAQVALTKLDTLQIKAGAASNRIGALGLSLEDWRNVAQNFAGGVVNAFDSFAQAVANGENAMQALGKAFLQLTADILKQIAQIIIQKTILNALGGLFPGLGLGTAHTGGLVGGAGVGAGNMRKGGITPIGAQLLKYHTGGIAGLKPDEVPAVLREGEEVLTPEDPNHRNNRTAANKSSKNDQGVGIKQLLVLNERELANALATSHGEKVIITALKRNAATVRKIIG